MKKHIQKKASARKGHKGHALWPWAEQAAVYGVAALVIGVVAILGITTDKGDTAVARLPSVEKVSVENYDPMQGSDITLLGSNFEPGATVAVGGRTVQDVNLETSTTLRAVTTVPFSAGDTVTVTNPDGESVSKAIGLLPQSPQGGGTARVNALDLSIYMSSVSNSKQADAAGLATLAKGWTW